MNFDALKDRYTMSSDEALKNYGSGKSRKKVGYYYKCILINDTAYQQ